MAFQVTARKWRPKTFDEVVGQEHITTTLKNAISTGRIAQSYLFCGPRGVGKTTAARILAKSLNCLDDASTDPCNQCRNCQSIGNGTSMNVLEIDGASNNSVDDVRELREVVRYVSTEGTYKIYIIDEVHMLSTPAFNALLKTLEEPPAHVVFVFATTEVHEVPDTILSRCQRFNFRRIPVEQISAHLAQISTAEGIDSDEEALFQIAARADGSLRDAQSMFDQVVAFDQEKVTVTAVSQVLGLVDRSIYFDLSNAIAAGKPADILDIVSRAVDAGLDIDELALGFAEHLRHLLFARVQGESAKLELAAADCLRYHELAADLAEEDILRMLHTAMELEPTLRQSAHPRFRLELALVRLSLMERTVDVGQLLQLLRQLEGGPGPGQASQKPSPDMSGGRPISPPVPNKQQELALSTDDKASTSTSAARPEEYAAEDPGPAVDSTAAPGDSDLERMKSSWADLVERVRQSHPTLGIFLKDVTLLSLENDLLKLGFEAADRFPMSQVEKNRATVEEFCSESWGRSLRVSCTSLEPGSKQLQKVEPREDPRVKSVLEAFDGELV